MKLLKYIPLLFILVLAACGTSSDEEMSTDKAKKKIDSTMSEDVLPFEYTTQDNKKMSNEDLKGKWWLTDFVFTNCTTVCIPMTSNMAKIQKQAAEENLDIEFVSFSIDPDTDSPEVLKEYADQYDADTSNWTFLTGYKFDTIKELSIKSFKNIAQMPQEGDQVIHGTRFYLVSPEGEVVKSYVGIKQEGIDEIMKDLKTIQ